MLSTTLSRVSFAGNGITTVFSFNGMFEAATDLVVVLRTDSTGAEVVKTLTTHYTVLGAGSESGGSVTMLTPPATGETLTVFRDPAIDQSLDLNLNQALPPVSLETAYDKLAIIAQSIRSLLTRTVQLPKGYSAAFDTTLPKLPTANSVLTINATADGFDLGPTVAGINADVTAAQTAATNAAASESNAASYEASALASKNAAAVSATNASNSASSASTSSGNASTYAGQALTSANNAATSATNAATSATNASTSATNAANSATAARQKTIEAKTANYSVLAGDDVILVDATLGPVTVTLLAAASVISGSTSKELIVIKTDASANAVTIAAQAGETVQRAATYVLAFQDDAAGLIPWGTNYHVI